MSATTPLPDAGMTLHLLPGSVPTLGQHLIQELLESNLLRTRDWDALPVAARERLGRHRQQDSLLDDLVGHKLLTEYQASRLKDGSVFGLLLGNYRVLDVLGSGGMGVVYKAEHLRLPKLVAIKVLPMSPDHDPRLLQRFYAEMGAIALLQHPNIVGAVDAGEAIDATPNAPRLHYFVMDYVAGESLEEKVRGAGPLPIAAACDYAHQVASALREAHRHGLVHRDIKPSNILITPEGQAKLLDFGLARQRGGDRLTAPGTALGTLDYMAPEQAQDAHSVDIRADIYGLGATLFWCLTARAPFPSEGRAVASLVARLNAAPPPLRGFRPDAPPELESVVSRMMAVDPAERYPTPQAVMQVILPFLTGDSRMASSSPRPGDSTPVLLGIGAPSVPHVLIVDDDGGIRDLCRYTLQADGIRCDEAPDGAAALEAVKTKRYDLILSDIDMPNVGGPELLRRLRAAPPGPHLKIIMFSGRASGDEMAQMLLAGADDYLTKPLSVVQVSSRVKSALRLKIAQDRSDLLTRHLMGVNGALETNLSARDSDLVHARNAMVLALAELVCRRDAETGGHLVRVQRYFLALAEEAAQLPALDGQLDEPFVKMVECCAPLHDIGKVALPDHILMKPGKLDAAERIIMQTHTTIGAETLRKVAERHGFAAAFLHTAVDVVRHHHERYDGRGYPDRLAGAAIPLCARLVSIADVYDALRNRRPYKPPLSHAVTVQVMTEASPGQFDPLLLEAFQRCAPQFERIARELPD